MADAQDFEKLGIFYLGKGYDREANKASDSLLLYESKDLTTHGVCVGMTGSGKTGLCLALLEEAAIDGIPAIAIDPKGDLGNLMLTFPDLKPESFKPWVDPAEATRRGLTLDQYAEKTAKLWKDGLAEWGEDGARIQRFKDAVDIAIYTPGSSAGLSLTVLKSFDAPGAAVSKDPEALRDRVSSSVAGLLALLGIDADPLRSREHILLSNLLDRAWREGRNLDMPALIREIQQPPFEKVGVLDLESFYPAKERFELSMSLNNLLASPGFSAWMEGDPLDVQRLLYTAEGKPRLSIISIAHLNDAERMFFVTLLLGEIIAWMRSQSGTSSLRALLYMDEVFGYFPPTANPPSKTPMLTLLKQARAYGLGVVLATQNPVDLDYKGLSNAGTWFLGRLQTERDKARVLDGLEGASAAAGGQFNRNEMEKILSGLGNRVFLMNNVHEDEPVVFQTRWALSYLRGPLTREQIGTLMAPRKQAAASAAVVSAQPVSASAASITGSRPILPPGIVEFFVPRRAALPPGAKLVYRPSLVGTAKVHFVNSASGVDLWESLVLMMPAIEDITQVSWDKATASAEATELEKDPEENAGFASLPSELSQAKRFTSFASGLKDYLYREHRLQLFQCGALEETSRPGESEGDFRVRIKQAAVEERDLQVAKLRSKYAPKLTALAERLRKAEQKVEREKTKSKQKLLDAAIAMGTSILSAVFGRKLRSTANVTRAASSARAAGRVLGKQADVSDAEDSVEAIQQRLDELDAEFREETAKLQSQMSAENLELEPLELQPRKADITV